jgi:tripartite-type tricarboxylate transporter receptor subunit TctC
MPYLPDLPTLRELGHQDFVSLTWFSLSGPAGLPKEIVDGLNREIVKAMDTPQIRAQLEQAGIEVKPMNPAEVVQHAKSEMDRWVPLVTRIMATKAQ